MSCPGQREIRRAGPSADRLRGVDRGPVNQSNACDNTRAVRSAGITRAPGARPMVRPIHRLTAAALLAAASIAATAQVPSGSAFTYQRKLQASRVALTGAADFQFRLFDSAAGGNQVGSTQSLSNVGVVRGLFTSRLDFGA